MFHRWTVFEDITVCTYAMHRKTDPKSIAKLSMALGIPANKVSYRMCNFTKLVQGKCPAWHFSRQERKVFDWLSLYGTSTVLSIKPI